MKGIYNTEPLARAFCRRVQEGDLLSRDHFVIPIKEGGKTYGTLSRQFASRYPEVAIPDLSLREARTLSVGDGRTVTFVAYWDESCAYTPNHMSYCAARALRAFSSAASKNMGSIRGDEPFCLSFPLFKGAEKSAQALAHLQWEICQVESSIELIGHVVCEAEVVVRSISVVQPYS